MEECVDLDLSANAKINLHLEITGRRSDGYHTVDTVMQEISISDRVSVNLIPQKEGIVIKCNVSSIPLDERNIAYKAALKYLACAGVDCGVEIILEKNIPHEAGLGGGSADGAAVLIGLNSLCGGAVDDFQMHSIAASLGADVPFFLHGGTAIMNGIGADFVEAFETPDLHIVIAKPTVGISTPAAYGYLDRIYNGFDNYSKADITPIVNAIKQNDTNAIASSMYNIFETAADELCVASKDLRLYMKDNSYGALLSGSGSSVFAIADGKKHAIQIAEKVKTVFPDYFVTYTTTLNKKT
jgi:4-diphosphocytidyl-2-C-methyl-D-erythritol kinase